MSNLKKGQSAPLNKVEPKVKDEARPEIASEGVKVVDVEEVIPSPANIEVKKVPLQKEKPLGQRASRKKKIVNIKNGVESKKDANKKNGVVKVKSKKVVAFNEPKVSAKRKAGRPKMNDKQKLIAKIIRDGKKVGKVISAEQADVIYYQIKAAARIKSDNDARYWLKCLKKLPDGVCKQMLILMALTAVIKGKLGMPKNTILYKERSIDMAQVQTLNVSGYYTTVFAGLALWITRNGILTTAISNKERNDGTGSTAIVKAKKADVKLSLDLFMIYINALALANQTLAVSIIETALCVVIVRKARTVIDFQYKMGPGTGNIRLISAACNVGGKRVGGTYEFQYGYMVAGVMVWTSLPSQKNCKILLTGMATGVLTFFRKRSSTVKGGMSAWCAPISTGVL